MKKFNFNLVFSLFMLSMFYLVVGILIAVVFKNINMLLFFDIASVILVVSIIKPVMRGQLISRRTRKETLNYIHVYLLIDAILMSILFYLVFNVFDSQVFVNIPNLLHTKNIWIHLFYFVFKLFIAYSIAAMWTHKWLKYRGKITAYVWITLGVIGLVMTMFKYIMHIPNVVYYITLPVFIAAIIPLFLYTYRKNQVINLI